MIVYIVIAPKVRYERYRYCIDNEAIRVREGLFWISESIVPIERLHKIQVSQGPIARMFNLSTVCVTTAGGDVNIKFLAEIFFVLKKLCARNFAMRRASKIFMSAFLRSQNAQIAKPLRPACAAPLYGNLLSLLQNLI